MIILHDPATLLHSTVEFLGAKLISALECPERISTILRAAQSTNHEIKIIHIDHDKAVTSGENQQSLLFRLLKSTHKQDYLDHLRTAYAIWYEEGLLEKDGTVLPECFPNKRMFDSQKLDSGLADPPKDIFARAGYYAFDLSAGISTHTWTSALASANLAVEGCRLITTPAVDASNNAVFALCRPPGHHCTTSMAGGYCYINNAVIAVESIRSFVSAHGPTSSMPKIAILDLDFHHGNGTQDYFYRDPGVLYVSIHGQDEYPYYSGQDTERGEGEGLGFNVNLPLPADWSVEQYLEKVELAIEHIGVYKPTHIIVSLGFDTFHLDRLGCFKLYTESYDIIARRFRSANALKNIPSLILLEGGYFLESLGENVIAFLQGWERTSTEISQNQLR
jgi:acetoin utilization deacetylase AcuC-like enzyme